MKFPLRIVYFFVFLAIGSSAFADWNIVEETFTAKCDGSKEAYVSMLPDGFKPDQTCDLLIILHGHGGDRWQFVKSEQEICRAIRDVAAARRMLVVSPDYRAKTSWMGPKAEADLLQIIDELKAKYKIGKVFLGGGSMGGSSSMTFAAMHPELLDGVIAYNGTANHLEYENFQDAISESYGGTKAKIPAEYKKRSAEYWPERFTMPIAFTTGGKDDVVPPQSVQRLAAVLKKLQPNVLLIHEENGGHETNYANTKQALEFVLDKAAESNKAKPAGEKK
jgi:pimeloyl-ACP methyl ester carboxylesterase